MVNFAALRSLPAFIAIIALFTVSSAYTSEEKFSTHTSSEESSSAHTSEDEDEETHKPSHTVELKVNNTPIQFWLNVPSEGEEKAKLTKAGATREDTNKELQNHLLGGLSKYADSDTAELTIDIKNDHPTMGTEALRNLQIMATAFHKGDKQITETIKVPEKAISVDLLDLFPDREVPVLAFTDQDRGTKSIFEGDCWIEPFPFEPTSSTEKPYNTFSYIVIRQKFYTKPTSEESSNSPVPATAVIEYYFPRRTDDTVRLEKINIYSPKEQISLGNRLEYIMNGFTSLTLQNRYTGHPVLAKARVDDSNWISHKTASDITSFPMKSAVTVGAVALLAPYAAYAAFTAGDIASCMSAGASSMKGCLAALPLNWGSISEGLPYASKEVPGLYAVAVAGTTAFTTWVYYKAAGQSAHRYEFQKALVAFAIGGKDGLPPQNISPFRAAFSSSSSALAINTEARTRTQHRETGASHGNTALMHFPLHANGLRKRH